MCYTTQELQAYANVVLASETGPDGNQVDLLQGEAVIVAVELFVREGYTFTGYNVTRQLRELFPLKTNGVYIFHESVRELVHALYDGGQMSGYERYQDTQLPDMPFAFRPVGDVARQFPPNQALIMALGQVQASIQPAAVLADPSDPTGGTAPPTKSVVGLLLSAASFSS